MLKSLKVGKVCQILNVRQVDPVIPTAVDSQFALHAKSRQERALALRYVEDSVQR